MERIVAEYTKFFRSALTESRLPEIDSKVSQYQRRLETMYASGAYRKHNAYPTMNVERVYAVIAMCLELKTYKPSLSDNEVIAFVNGIFEKKRGFLRVLGKCVNLLPNSFQIAREWNISDHDKRVQDGSLTYDSFQVTDRKIEYNISGCMYMEMFKYYGIRSLCKIFCMTDEFAYSLLPKHVRFVRHSDLSNGDSCHDEIIHINEHFRNAERRG